MGMEKIEQAIEQGGKQTNKQTTNRCKKNVQNCVHLYEKETHDKYFKLYRTTRERQKSRSIPKSIVPLFSY